MDIKIPFSLISTDVQHDRLIVVPGYWFLYNMYAVIRNSKKFGARDKRTKKNQYLEYDVLAPDTINEMFDSLRIIEDAVGKCMSPQTKDFRTVGRTILQDDAIRISQDIYLENVENSKRRVVLLKPKESYKLFHRLIKHYAALEIVEFLSKNKDLSLFEDLTQSVHNRLQFKNVGGQLIPTNSLDNLINDIKSNKINLWDSIHKEYHIWSKNYKDEKRIHALASLAEITNTKPADWTNEFISNIITESLETQKWIFSEIYNSRKKDYINPFRSMVYDSKEEMDIVIGSLEDNSFIKDEEKALDQYITKTNNVLKLLAEV